MLKIAVAILVLLANQAYALEVSERSLKGSWKIVSYNGNPSDDEDDRWEFSGNHMSQVTYFANGKIRSMSPSVFYITNGHFLEIDSGVVNISQLDEQVMKATVIGIDFVFRKVSDEVYVKPRAKEKAVSEEATAMASGMAKALFENGEENAKELSCPKAVKDTWRFLDQSVLQGEVNFNDGYITKQELADASKKFKTLRDAIDVKSCESSQGDTKNFYLCLSNPKNIILYCANKYTFNVSQPK
ncbi:hypothetical protein [Rhodoferax saidenbachensis]|uniref:Lipocalin-like domain-containing protein n=1 Tax=Rhodoferax saidenbachensis TaxID=1484693 RepID=A0ABU1ZQ62_9BURK|nr:hypothetical protein [Rhodoferax saidenbachensis]MDR7307699.1 hypothetical protein [Rhodoferax saidenbachensis]